MTDQTPFVPPGGQPPVAPPAYASPSPYGPPPSIPPAAPPPKKKMKAGVIVAIVSGSVLLVGGLVVGLVSLTTFLAESISESVPELEEAVDGAPLVTGEDASPVAVEPMECGGCFTDNDIGSTIVSQAELDAVGLTSTLQPWTENIAHYDSEALWFKNAWNDAEGEPDECFVTFPTAPISSLEPGTITDDGSVVSYTGTFADDGEYSTLGQSVRIFSDDQDAVDYMAALPALIESCTRYASGSGNTYWRADVSPAPALTLPPSVAAIGWVEKADAFTRYYSFDVQRGNIVVRTGLFTYDEISELEYRALIEHLAVQISEMVPAPSF